jgi:hypothetical protein
MPSMSLRVSAVVWLAAALVSAMSAHAQEGVLDPTRPGSDGRNIQRTAPPAAPRAVPGTGAVGRYAPLREAGKDTGCMITLEASGRAQLAPACRDQGLVIFDPILWRVEQGQLALTARKGHKVYFDKQANGVWLRDPKEGKALALRPI